MKCSSQNRVQRRLKQYVHEDRMADLYAVGAYAVYIGGHSNEELIRYSAYPMAYINGSTYSTRRIL